MSIFELPWFTIFFALILAVLFSGALLLVVIFIQDKIKGKNKK
jgi:hypothetical protein